MGNHGLRSQYYINLLIFERKTNNTGNSDVLNLTITKKYALASMKESLQYVLNKLLSLPLFGVS